MSLSFTASDYRSWAAYGLADYGDFAECVTDINQHDDGFDQTAGEWYYVADDVLVVPDQGSFRVIYGGSWGNYNSPGASHYTHAELYDVADDDDMREFTDRVAELDACPEWLESDDDEHCEGCGMPHLECECGDEDESEEADDVKDIAE